DPPVSAGDQYRTGYEGGLAAVGWEVSGYVRHPDNLSPDHSIAEIARRWCATELGRQPPVDQQRRQRGQGQHQRTQPEPSDTGVASDRLVTDLLLQRRVDLLELLQVRGAVMVAARQFGNFFHRGVIDRHRLALAVDLHEAVRGAERD